MARRKRPNPELRDADNPELTDDFFRKAKPAREVLTEIVGEAATDRIVRRGRGPAKRPTKQLVSLRIDREVLWRFRASGRGWQSRLNDLLRKAVLGKRASSAKPASKR